ncbi:MAG: hypothetical protein ABI689_05670 [Thermoanaerobaculia bacterium]
MNFQGRSQMLVVVALAFGACLAAAPAQAAEEDQACCKIIRVDLEKDTAWLRNPKTAKVVQFRLGADSRELFKVGDLYSPETGELNGAKLQRNYSLSLPALGDLNGSIQRVRGREVSAKMDEGGTVYRFRAPSFGNLLSDLEPGQGVLIDVPGDWIFVYHRAYGDEMPSVLAFEIE